MADDNKDPDSKSDNGVKTQAFETGSAGTNIYAGYIYEEPLRELRGILGAKKYNEMSRGDANIAMILAAMILPVRSAQWGVEPSDESSEAIAQAALMNHIIFDDMEKPWSQFSGETLTCIRHGWSLFETTFKPVLSHETYGPYIGIKNLGFRGQTTIEKWNVDKNGKLLSVEQIAEGDTARTVNIDADHLIRFCPDQEGDNFEGISKLRPSYGSWFRKNVYLKLLAAGIEKYAIPFPIMTVPEGKENSPEYTEALKVLRAYTSNQANWMTKPAGWDIEVKSIVLDPQKIRECIKDENTEMVNSVLAAFLLLGQNSSGSYSLGSTLGDFFGTSIQFIGDHICEVMNRQLIKKLVALNYGTNAPVKCFLKVEGIKDSASSAFGDLLQKLVAANVIRPDADLEAFTREKLKLPVANEATRYEPKLLTTPGSSPEPFKFSERKEQKKDLALLIRKGSEELRAYVESSLTALKISYIEKLGRNFDAAKGSDKILTSLPNSTQLQSTSDYQSVLTSLSILQAKAAKDSIMGTLKLAEGDDKKLEKLLTELQEAVSDYDRSRSGSDLMRISTIQRDIKAKLSTMVAGVDLTSDNIRSIKSRVETLVSTQANDLKKKIDLQYQNSVDSTDSKMVLFNDLEEAGNDFTSSPATTTGPDLLASQNINQSILKETEDDPEVESYSYVGVDDDSQTALCHELNGRTVSKNDPILFRLAPSCHYGCRSYWAVNLRSFKGNPPINTDTLKLSKAAQDCITL